MGKSAYYLRLTVIILSLVIISTGYIEAQSKCEEACDLSGLYTLTQGGWGSKSTSQPGKLRDQYFSAVFPSGLVVGGNYTLTLNSARAVQDFLPNGGTPAALNKDYVNPKTTSAGNLAAQTVALKLNVAFDDAGKTGTNPLALRDLVIASGPLAGKTVGQLLDLCNIALGGGSTQYTYSQLSDAATKINENFDEGKTDKHFLTCPVSPASIGDKVWNDANNNGIQDAGENGISGVTVKLYDCNNVLKATTNTDANGSYSFTSLTPGDYYVKFILPAGYQFSPKDAANNDLKDSDVDAATGRTVCTSLAAGENDMSWDAGVYKQPVVIEKASIGDKVWNDINANGIQDAGENGIPGVTVKLYSCDNQLKAATLTDAEGEYLFAELNPGDYYVSFTLPAGYAFSTKNAGQNNAMDSDADQTTGKTSCTTLAAGEDDLTFDAGMYVMKASLGDKVWNDENKNGIQDAGENGISGVTVKLYTCSNEIAGVLTTNSAGNYSFTNLMPGDYYVVFELPNFYSFTSKDAGGNDALDSDADAVSGRTVCVTLAAGENNTTLDAGLFLNEEQSQSDLSLVKTADNLNPKIGDQVVYTITVTNNGPASATGVTAVDLLSDGQEYISSVPSKGSFDVNTGIWTIGDLTSGQVVTLKITVKVNPNGLATAAFDLGVAKDFNLFALENVTQPSSDTQGRMAAGGDITLSGYSVGDQLPAGDGTVDVLIAGHNLTFTSGRVYNGNVVYGNATNLPVSAVSITEGTLRKDSVINFVQARVYLQTLSQQLAAYEVNDTTRFEWGAVKLTGRDPFMNVFMVKGSELSAANNMEISVPNGSVVLVNIDGKNVSWTGGLTVVGTDKSNVLFNFFEAEFIKIQGIDVRGTVLAPWAEVNFIAGVQHGQMICKSFKGQGQLNLAPFIGNIPVYPDIINVAEISTVNQHDPDSTPGNGDDDEDDYGRVVLHINTDNSGSGVGEGTGNSSWQFAGNFSLNEIVWDLSLDSQNNLLAATWGGKIYRTADNGRNWVRINNDMTVGYVWSIANNSNGMLLAGTEQGLFVSADNGSTWHLSGITGKDVRAIAIDPANNNIYAGTWGYGIFKSTDNGETWNRLSAEPSNLAVHAISINANSEIYAGTFGSGVLKSTDNGTTWNKLNVGYDHIWALGISSNGNIYAGTYGDGMYRSTDNGANWTKSSNGINSAFIYSITMDAGTNVYVGAWAEGVYTSADNGNEWSSMGMNGLGVSSVIVNPYSNSLYVGTSNGAVYTTRASATGVQNDENTVPVKFALEQNYPNPFNPSTSIKFSIPSAGHYELKVYDVLGKEVATLVNENYNPGNYTVNFNAAGLSSGMYIYRLSGSNVNMVKKMMLLK